MTSIEPELWVERARDTIAFYESAFGATVLHRVGEGDDVVAQLAMGDARYWISNASANRPSPRANRGATGRVLLVVDNPDDVAAQACARRCVGAVSGPG
jgi:PhnB protein